MAIWTYFDFVSPAGNNQIVEWLDDLTIQERSDLDAMLEFMSKQQQWSEPNFKSLSGKKHQGLGEFRFKSQQGTPLRLIGTKGDTPNSFIFLIGCSHRGKKYDPPAALDTAAKRKKQLANTATTCEHGEKTNGDEREDD